ncbi:glycosyltransferase [Marinagarivorans cellulosilyticus]|uniref:Glycosyltransferase subfamily 4-like N-terminal domain-containing protein n=1 Tax=Marinagarivorans cellulosilyticus TaxID=2721545 RepID=A0AAN1WIQ1_9GAMM|nr:glycosyltransferase [Marinagarivorans cellulosilyticus]BCD98332.1 hypothetical protein MARGE09_P2533 [Marinagarivorans cellulosilyticus]
MKILHLSYSDADGGAARAAFRLHIAQRKAGLDSHMLVVNKQTDNPFVHSVGKSKWLRIKIANIIASRLLRLQKTSNPVHHSLNFFASGILQQIDRIAPDIVNLHWVGGEMISVGEISRIKQPAVWTMHDMWPFCGAEHYSDPAGNKRYVQYSTSAIEVDPSLSGVDINKWRARSKAKSWTKKSITYVCPTNWLAGCARESSLLANSQITVIPNCIDHDLFKPVDKQVCRHLLGLPQNKKLILFGAMSSTSDPRKGFALLESALEKLRGRCDFELVVFGASGIDDICDIKTHYMGILKDDISLVALYNACNLFVAPSLQDNLPNTLVESLACGVPCIAFDIGGMQDLVRSSNDGALVQSIDCDALADAIASELLNDAARNTLMHSKLYREEAAVASQYRQLYEAYLR